MSVGGSKREMSARGPVLVGLQLLSWLGGRNVVIPKWKNAEKEKFLYKGICREVGSGGMYWEEGEGLPRVQRREARRSEDRDC
jgi:hypothetical protein